MTDPANAASENPNLNVIAGEMIGKVIYGRYEIVEKIAHGGMATVYKALDRRLDRIVAIKLMHPHLANGPDGATFATRFRREAKAAAKLHHPGIVTVFDQGIDGDINYLTMEYVAGTNLRRQLKDEGTFYVGKALKTVEHILNALAAAHRSELVHRDIKPENILINSQGRLQITDFGLARVVTEMSTSTTGTVFGTVAYLAPEIIETGNSDPRSDIYAIGIMLYEMIAGMQPYEGTTPIQVAFKHVNEDVPHITDRYPQIPQKIALMIDVFCARDEANRPVDATDALRILKNVASELSPEDMLIQLPRPVLPKNSDNAPDISVADVSNALQNDLQDDGTVKLDEMSDFPTDASNLAQNSSSFNPEDDPYYNGYSDSVVIAPSEHANNEHTALMSEQDAIDTNFLTNTQLNDLRSVGDHERQVGGTNALNQFGGYSDYNNAQNDENVNNDADSDKKLTKKRKILLIILGVAVCLLIGIGIWWYNIFGPGSQTTVPYGLTHVSVNKAENILDEVSLKYEVVEEFSDDIDKGNVISTDPESGESIAKRGKNVKLVVSKGIKNLDLPSDIIGLNVDEALKELNTIGFDNIAPPEHVFNRDVPKDQVISITPIGGSKQIAHNTAITLTVSDGAKPAPMPNLVGASIEDAAGALEEIGLLYSRLDSYSDDVAAGVIMAQATAVGTTVYDGDTVQITVSRGSEFVVTPDVTRQGVEQAKATLEAAGLKYSISGEAVLGLVQRQSVAAGTRIKRGEVVTLIVV